MSIQTTFKRYELKFLLTKKAHQDIVRQMAAHMHLDQYGHVTIRNLYYDTPDYRLIRRSLEKPVYKEKLRIRSYAQVGPKERVFVELKKKYDSVVYKRRLSLPEETVAQCFSHQWELPVDSQIGREISYFRHFYGDLRPAVFLSYEREAYYALDGSDFRVTFDENILFRTQDFSLRSGVYGEPVLGDDQVLMEIKTSGGIPLCMTGILSSLGLRKTSFSKYGAVYESDLRHRQEFKGVIRYA